MNHSKREEKTAPTSWILVLGLLLGLPLLFALILRLWLGVPEESPGGDLLFRRLNLTPVGLVEQRSLLYGDLFFTRFRVEPEELAALRAQLEGREKSEGVPEKPISLKLERPWWDPPSDADGVYWRSERVILWSPLTEPDLFYGVAEMGEGVGPTVSKSPE